MQPYRKIRGLCKLEAKQFFSVEGKESCHAFVQHHYADDPESINFSEAFEFIAKEHHMISCMEHVRNLER